MSNLVRRTLYRLSERLPGRVSTPGDKGYAEATAIWAKPVGRSPRAVVHCHTVRLASRRASPVKRDQTETSGASIRSLTFSR